MHGEVGTGKRPPLHADRLFHFFCSTLDLACPVLLLLWATGSLHDVISSSSHHLLLLLLLIIILFLYAAVLLASRWPCIGLPLPLLLLWGLSRRLAVSVALHNL